MNEFRVFAHGTEFDVDSFAQNTSLPITRVWHRGEQRRFYRCPTSYETSGFEITLGDGMQLLLPEQERLAAEFLAAHEAWLRPIGFLPGVEAFILGLQRRIEVRPALISFCVSPRRQLMRLALSIGLDITYYVQLVHPEASATPEAPA